MFCSHEANEEKILRDEDVDQVVYIDSWLCRMFVKWRNEKTGGGKEEGREEKKERERKARNRRKTKENEKEGGTMGTKSKTYIV